MARFVHSLRHLGTTVVAVGQALMITGCESIEKFVDVRDPSLVTAQSRFRGEVLSEGTSGVIVHLDKSGTQTSVDHSFRLPGFCDGNFVVEGVSGPPQRAPDLAELRPLLVDRRERAAKNPIQITCSALGALGVHADRNAEDQRQLFQSREYSLATTAANIDRLRQVGHGWRVAGIVFGTLAGTIASLCGVGILASDPPSTGPDVDHVGDQKAALTTCALVSAPIAAVATLIAVLDPKVTRVYGLEGPAPVGTNLRR